MKFHKWPIAHDEESGGDGDRRREWACPWGRRGEERKERGRKRGRERERVRRERESERKDKVT